MKHIAVPVCGRRFCSTAAADGLTLCRLDARELRNDIMRSGLLYSVLELEIAPSGSGTGTGERVATGPSLERGLRVNDRVIAIRAQVRLLLMSTARMIQSVRGSVPPPAGHVGALAAYVHCSAEWLAATPEAGALADGYAEMVRVAERAAYPDRRIGPATVASCPHPGCPGMVRAVVVTGRPMTYRCGADDAHRWTSIDGRRLING